MSILKITKIIHITLKIPIRNKEKSDFISLADILVVFFSLLNSSKKETTEPINTNNAKKWTLY